MPDSNKSKKALLEELQTLRSRVAELERKENEYKRTEQALRENQERYAMAEQIGHFSHWERNLVEDKATWSEESYRIFGVDPNRFQPSYENFLNLIHPYDRGHVKNALEVASLHGKGFDIEYRIVRPDGVERVLHSVAEVRFDESGRPVKLVGTAHDITEQKQAEEELLKAHDELERRVGERTADLAKTNALLEGQIAERKRVEETLKTKDSAIASSINAIAFADIEGNLTYVNDSFLKLWGYSDEKQVLGKPVVQFWVDGKKAAEVRDKGNWIGELVAKRKDNSTFDVEVSASLVKDGAGNRVGTMASFIDITERKKAEEALRESEERLRLALSAADMGTWRWNPVINQDTRDASFNRILGLSAAESTQPVEDFLQRVHPDDRDMVDKEIQCSIRDRRPYLAEFRIVRPDGAIRWLRDQGKVLCDENDRVSYMTGAVVDITKRKRAEEALRESEEKFRTFMETASDLMHITDKDGYFTYVNEATAETLGYSKEEMLGMHITDILSEETRKDFEPRLKQLIVKGEIRADSVWATKEGREICGEITLVAVYDSDREFAGTRAIFRDITERKRAEDTLQKARDELGIRVEQRTAELARANEQLLSLASELSLAEERLRHQIATDVHDHIGQNLAISKIKLESLRESMSSPELAVALDEIRELIAQTIESSRSLTFELSPPVLYELGFEAAVEWLVRRTREKHGLSAEFKSDGRSKPLSHDVSVLLFQAVRELLLNVAKHAQAQNVTVSTRRVGDEIQVTVEDDGVGFDTSKTTSRDYQIGGFGLFSIRERLRSIGGRFDIESRPGAGTRVTLAAHIDNGNEDSGEKRK